MDFQFGQTVYRDRRKRITDPYNPDSTVAGSWDDPLDTIPLDQAFVASSSSTPVADATRTQILTNKSLYVTDPNADVRSGDRIRAGSTYYVNARPEADTSPFTGWQPAVEIPLDLTEG